MMTCNRIFWRVVVPTITFGSKVWVISERDEENLLSFQKDSAFKIVKDMTLGTIPVVSKKAWSKIIWERAWSLAGADWKASNII